MWTQTSIWDEVVNLLTPWKYTVLNENFVSNTHDFDLQGFSGM